MSTTQTLSVAFVVLSSAVVAGCASRKPPFDALDQSTVTILKLQQQQQAALPAPPSGVPLIPGLPPDVQAAADAFINQLKNSGLPIPPGLIPGVGGNAPPPQPQMQPYANDPTWGIADTRPVVDQKLKDDLLDLFGSADSFDDQYRGQCWYPGMAVSFQSPNFPQPVDVVVSISCTQAVGYGFQWPHQAAGLTPQSSGQLAGIYQSLFGPLPPQG